MANPAPKGRLELLIELIKVLVWPILTVILIISFWTPLQRTAALVPSLIGTSDTITIAGLSLKIRKGLQSTATPKVKFALANLSKTGIENVLKMSNTAWSDSRPEGDRKRNDDELHELGLIEEISDKEIRARNAEIGRDFRYAIRRTEFGREVQSFLNAIIAEFAQKLGGPQAEPWTSGWERMMRKYESAPHEKAMAIAGSLGESRVSGYGFGFKTTEAAIKRSLYECNRRRAQDLVTPECTVFDINGVRVKDPSDLSAYYSKN